MYDYDACLIYTPNDHYVADSLIQSLSETAHLRVMHHRFDITSI